MADVPSRFDTEHFYAEYQNIQDTLMISLKNESITRSVETEDRKYRLYDNEEGIRVRILINHAFREPYSPDQYLNVVLREFVENFRKNKTDYRHEIVTVISRFHALRSYEALDYGPDQFSVLKISLKRMLIEIKTKLPNQIEKRETIEASLKENAQNDGYHAENGMSFYPTRDYVWILSEMTIQNSDKPEYLWKVNGFSAPEFHIASVQVIRTHVENHIGYQTIMDEQRKRYGYCHLDLVKIKSDLKKVAQVIRDLEIIVGVDSKNSLLEQFNLDDNLNRLKEQIGAEHVPA